MKKYFNFVHIVSFFYIYGVIRDALIEVHEWTWKSATPAYQCRRVEEKTGWKFECEKVIQPQGGWIITRTK